MPITVNIFKTNRWRLARAGLLVTGATIITVLSLQTEPTSAENRPACFVRTPLSSRVSRSISLTSQNLIPKTCGLRTSACPIKHAAAQRVPPTVTHAIALLPHSTPCSVSGFVLARRPPTRFPNHPGRHLSAALATCLPSTHKHLRRFRRIPPRCAQRLTLPRPSLCALRFPYAPARSLCGPLVRRRRRAVGIVSVSAHWRPLAWRPRPHHSPACSSTRRPSAS